MQSISNCALAQFDSVKDEYQKLSTKYIEMTIDLVMEDIFEKMALSASNGNFSITISTSSLPLSIQVKKFESYRSPLLDTKPIDVMFCTSLDQDTLVDLDRSHVHRYIKIIQDKLQKLEYSVSYDIFSGNDYNLAIYWS
jgi:hypothetical protein